jgi:hypothetical protein
MLVVAAEGYPPEQRQAMEAAINNGTIQFRKRPMLPAQLSFFGQL